MKFNYRSSHLQKCLVYLSRRIEGYSNKPAIKTFGYKKTQWANLPNCMGINLGVREWDEKLRDVGIYKKVKKTQHRIDKVLPNRLNKYLRYQERRLMRLRSDPKKYWDVAWRLMVGSTVFQVSALNKVMKGWEKNTPFRSVMKTFSKVRFLIREGSWSLKYKRVYIPKNSYNSDQRPLGVPTLEWRIYLHMYTNMMTMFLGSELLVSQHGFIRKRGCVTAWKDLFSRISARFIYETDLKQFFPSVTTATVLRYLNRYRVPSIEWIWVEKLCNNFPRMPKILKADETRILEAKARMEEGQQKKDMLSQMGFRVEPNRGPIIFGNLPQGSPLSPLLTILTMKPFLSQQTSISYADDPIFFSEEDFKVYDQPPNGLVIHEDKSFWVKREGKWLAPLKYLGLIYDAATETLSSKTRFHQRSLTLDKSFLEKVARCGSKLTGGDRKTGDIISWSELSKTKIFPFLTSRLYEGQLAPLRGSEYVFKPVQGSLIDLIPNWTPLYSKIDVTNSSSIGCFILCEYLTRMK